MVDQRKTVLIIDDNVDMVEAIGSLLKPKDVLVLEATDPDLAVRLALNYMVDVLVLDLKMPGLNGIEVLSMVRRRQPNVKVVVYSGYVNDFKHDLEKVNIDYVLEKPAEAEQLLVALESCIGSLYIDKASSASRRTPRAKLLIVDDEEEVCTILKENIEEAQIGEFQIELAHDAEQALDKAMVLEPDLVFVDIKMPHTWGDELIERMKMLPIRKPKAYFILTAAYDENMRSKLIANGHLYFTKPFNLDELFKHLIAKCYDLGLVKSPV